MCSEIPSKKLEKMSKEYRMSDAATAQELMRLCFPVGSGGVKDAWNRAREILGWPDRRIKAIWYGEALRIDSHEMQELENAKTAAFVARLDSVRASMLQANEGLYQEEARALAAVARSLRRQSLADG